MDTVERHLRDHSNASCDVVTASALAVTAHGAHSCHHLPDRALSDAELDALLATAGRHRLVGAVAEVVASGAMAVTEPQRARVARVHSGWMTQSLAVERLLLRVDESFSSEGIDGRVLKGVALGHLVYGDPAWRVFADLDVLVRGEQLDRAIALARDDLGGVRAIPELRPGFDREFGKEAVVRVGPVELDVHRTFVTGPFGLTVPLDELFASSTAFVVGGHELLALGAEDLFLHACYNAALGDHPVRLCSLRDLLLVHERATIDHGEVRSRARDWRATAVVQHAASVTVERLGLTADHPLTELAAWRVPRRESRLLRSYHTSARSYRRPLASLAVIRGVRPRVRYARALIRPSREYLDSRGWSQRGHVLRSLRRLRSSRDV